MFLPTRVTFYITALHFEETRVISETTTVPYYATAVLFTSTQVTRGTTDDWRTLRAQKKPVSVTGFQVHGRAALKSARRHWDICPISVCYTSILISGFSVFKWVMKESLESGLMYISSYLSNLIIRPLEAIAGLIPDSNVASLIIVWIRFSWIVPLRKPLL